MNKEVWVRLPKILPKNVPRGWKPGIPARAIKAVYGLADAPRLYTNFFKAKAETLGWIQVAESILIKQDKLGNVTAVMIMHVDDLIIASEDPVVLIDQELTFVVQLDKAELLEEGQEFSYVGLTLSKKKDQLLCDQSIYVKNVQIDLTSKEASRVLKEKDVSDQPAIEDICLEIVPEMQRLMGIFGWASKTQPHLSYMFGELSRWSTKPTKQKLLTAKRVCIQKKTLRH
eukprot:GHVR01045375.1.p1 GENE.GHVR01045375.1~~GHVR01045375.1.p1  ORF type:complete len:229 (+),score=27.51 GHVR01045375.1:335-1021(+)